MDNLKEPDFIDFKSYIDSVKNGQLPWKLFESLMKDLCQTFATAKELNIILIEELKHFLDKDVKIENFTKPSSVKNDTDPLEEANEVENEEIETESEIPEIKPDLTYISGIENYYNEEFDHKFQKSCTKCSRATLDEICDSCKQSTESKSVKRISIIDQNKIEDLRCDQCDKIFTQKENKYVHMKNIHEKNFQCSQCDRAFGMKCYRDRHFNQVHLKIKPFKCDFCGTGFPKVSRLKNHVQSFHDTSKIFKCKICKNTFRTRFDVKRHFQQCKK